MNTARKVTLAKKVPPVNNTATPKEPRWLDFYELIFGERRITTGQLADAIENVGFRGWDEYGRFLQFDPKMKDQQHAKARQDALLYIANVWKWRVETTTEECGEDDPTGIIPLAGFGWYANELPSFGKTPPEQPKHGAAGGAMKGENYKLRIMGALIDLWTGHAVSPPEKTKAALVAWLTDIEETAQCWDLKSPDAVKKQFDEIQKLLSGRLLFQADYPQLK